MYHLEALKKIRKMQIFRGFSKISKNVFQGPQWDSQLHGMIFVILFFLRVA